FGLGDLKCRRGVIAVDAQPYCDAVMPPVEVGVAEGLVVRPGAGRHESNRGQREREPGRAACQQPGPHRDPLGAARRAKVSEAQVLSQSARSRSAHGTMWTTLTSHSPA